MKKKYVWLYVVLALVFGAVQAADLVLFCEPDGGYVLAGSEYLRFVLLALMILASIPAAFITDKKGSPLLCKSTASAWLCRVGAILFAMSAFMYALNCSSLKTIPEKAMIPLLLVTALWLVFASACFSGRLDSLPGDSTGGAAAAVSFYLILIVHFALRPASYHRVSYLIQVLASLAALLFFTGLIRGLCITEEPQRKSLMIKSLAAFLLCTCVQMPREVITFVLGYSRGAEFVLSLAMAAVGLGGLFTAVALTAE